MNNSSIKDNFFHALFFDMDGLLADTETLHMKSWRQNMEEFGVFLKTEAFYRFIGLGDRECARILISEHGLDSGIDTLLERRRSVFEEFLGHTTLHPLPGVERMLTEAGASDMKTGIVSSTDRYGMEIILNKLFEAMSIEQSPEQFFDILITGDDVGRLKPDPEIYITASQRVGVSPEHCLVFEDSPTGTRAALDAGMAVVAIPNKYTHGGDFRGAHLILGSMEEIFHRGGINTFLKEVQHNFLGTEGGPEHPRQRSP